MIELKRGDILLADAEALVNTVNCVGVMGRGVALQFRKAFPENYEVYRAVCDRGELQPGRILAVRLGRLGNPNYVINFPTKKDWRGNSKLEYIDSGLAALVKEVQQLGIRSIAIPPLGCGLGGLKWEEVRPRIEHAFASLPDTRVLLYEPAGAPAAPDMVKEARPPKMTPGRAVLLQLIHRYLAALMDPFVTLLEVHKLMYFMQESGQDLKLRYSKGPYGPYAENLRHALSAIEGHFITGYGDAADKPDRRLELNPDAARCAEEFLGNHETTRFHFERVARLISGFETPYGMELLATVHWVAHREGAQNPKAALERIYSWNQRKRMFPEHHLQLAWSTLADAGWLATASENEPETR
jgi:O-acetyl-ADP-ribose deacetylase (regulator of RNase III)